MTRKQITLARRALSYAKRGDPIKDVFEHGDDEEALFIAALRFAVNNHKEYGHEDGEQAAD